MKFVQAYIANISYPTTLNETYKLAEQARAFDVETILGCGNNKSDNCGPRSVEWTAPKWCKQGDIVFFMHAKTANVKIRNLKNELIKRKCEYSNDEFWTIANALNRSKRIYDIYGGKIFAIGKISDVPFYDDDFNNADYHWKSSVFAPIDSIFVLEQPVDISEFNDEIMVSRQSSITPVLGEQFVFLKKLIIKNNHLFEKYFVEAEAEPMPLHNLNEENWLDVVNQHRRSFFLEAQFRSFYVDRFLRIIGDTKKFYKECACYKAGQVKTFVDNVILLNRKYLPVEVKLSVSVEKNIVSQLSTYCHRDNILLSKEKMVNSSVYQNYVLVIDTEKVYLYNDDRRNLKKVADLDTIVQVSDIIKLRDKIIEILSE